jgi:hypothetical protein
MCGRQVTHRTGRSLPPGLSKVRVEVVPAVSKRDRGRKRPERLRRGRRLGASCAEVVMKEYSEVIDG